MSDTDVYDKLIDLLTTNGAKYRVIEHAEEGQTEAVSALRGHTLQEAAKCIVVMVKVGKKTTKFVLAVVPGDARVSLSSIRSLLQGTYVSFASPDNAERLSGSASGTILPFSFDPDLELIVDPSMLEVDEFYFNAARLDRSIALSTRDYADIAKPRIAAIREVPVESGL
jgi:Ala-tRNA(Pro) deacylase